MDRFDAMTTFVKVYETRSISRAADRLNLSKSAVSRRIKRLEERLEVQLFHHKSRELVPTESGDHFYERATRILGELADLERELTDQQRAVEGRVRMAAPLTFGLRYLREPLLDLADEHPKLQLEIEFDDRLADLRREAYDLAVRVANLADAAPDWRIRKLADIRHFVCAAPPFWDEHGRPEHPNDLAGLPILEYPQFEPQGVVEYVAPDGTTGDVRAETTLTANNGEFLVDAARRGLGFGIAPGFFVSKWVEKGELEPVLDDYRWSAQSVWLLYPPVEQIPSRVRAVIDTVADAVASTPWVAD